MLPMEIDSFTMLMDAVRAGIGCTIQPLAALARFPDAEQAFELAEIDEASVRRRNSLCSVSDQELSPASRAVRVALAQCARELVRNGGWAGALLSHHED
jgi:LysR family tcuABC transcriptional regulator